jgi:hypothetical protein
LKIAAPKASFISRWPIRAFLALYGRLISGPVSTVADAYAALHQGLHHLIQYLCFLRGENEEYFTARANAPKLIRTSKELLDRVDKSALGEQERRLFRSTLRDRLHWLALFFYTPITPPSRGRLRTIWAASIALILGIGIALGAREAIRYHPIYVERMQSEANRSAQGAADDARPTAR